MYKEMYQLTETNRGAVTWASRVKDVLNRCGMGGYWINQRVDDKKYFLALFRRKLQDIYIQEWWRDVDNTSTGRLFMHIKTDFRCEAYLNKLD